MIFKQRLCECVVQLTLQNSPYFEGCCLPGGGGGLLPYMALTGTCGQIWYGFSLFCLKWDINFIKFCVKRGILTFKREKRTLEICENCTERRICTLSVGTDA